MSQPPPEVLEARAELGRELCFVVDASGAITWADARAAAAGLTPPETLASRCVPGAEAKAAALLEQAAAGSVRGWELALVIEGAPTTVTVAARPAADGGVVVVGSAVPQDFATAIAEGNRAIYEIVGLNRELARQKQRLEDSNRGIRSLHAELEQQTDRLRSAAEIKSRLVASVSHEFRTPLHSILGLSRLLLDHSDGPLTEEQERQVAFVRDAAQDLSRLINDMLDLSRIDAGSAPMRIQAFELATWLSALQGQMRPLLAPGSEIELVFDPAPDVPLETDAGKLSQIARNLVANALKYTARGSVRVTTAVVETAAGERLQLAVSDTGIGIAAEDQQRIFEEFVQIESALQRSARGTGLGLPIAQKLAHLLGGEITVVSTPDAGSTFTLSIPTEHAEVAEFRRIEQAALVAAPERPPVLVVEDDRSSVFAYERHLTAAGFRVIPARTTGHARELLRELTPSAILLDVMLEGEDTWDFLAELKATPATQDIPVLVCTVMNRESRARALGADEFWLKPVDQDKLIRKLQLLAAPRGARVLVIDDDPAARYLVRKCLVDSEYELTEASDGPSGVAAALAERPHVILLDFLLKDVTAFDVIDQLKADPRTRSIPVIVVTSHALPAEDRARLAVHTEAILSKEHLSRELAIARIRDALVHAGVTTEKGAAR